MKTLTEAIVCQGIRDAVQDIVSEGNVSDDRDYVIDTVDSETDFLWGRLVQDSRIDQYGVDDLINTSQACGAILKVAQEAGCVEDDCGLWQGLTYGVLASIAYFSLRNLVNIELGKVGVDINADYPFSKESEEE